MRTAEVVVCGAGIAGIAAAHELAVRRGVPRVVLVDPQPPLTVTSDKSTECYRDWWPQPAMARLVGRSLDLMEELAAATGNAFAMNRNGYAYVTASAEGARALEAGAAAIAAAGAGPLRVHRGAAGDPGWPETPWERLDPSLRGADLVLDRELLHARFPFLAADACALLHARRCGWVSAQQLGMVLLERARAAGVELVRGRLAGVERDARGIAAVRLEPAATAGAGGGPAAAGAPPPERLATRTLVAAPGPSLPEVARLAGLELPVFHELHAKVTFDDVLGLVPRELPLLIWTDPVTLDWPAEVRLALAEDPELRPLLGRLPGGVHFRPEGGRDSHKLLLLWAWDAAPCPPAEPPPFPAHLAEVVVRGVARMMPGFAVYLERMRRPFVDGGYYTKVADNLPLLGPTAVPGFHLVGALSGYGIMAAMGAAELAVGVALGEPAPEHAAAFRPERFGDAAYTAGLSAATLGQL